MGVIARSAKLFNVILGVFLVVGLVLNAAILEVGSADSSLEEVREIKELSWFYAVVGFSLIIIHFFNLRKNFVIKPKRMIGIIFFCY